ncbi:hypothetical protein Avbf_09989 [Armadillidium vulgare]|nr:hypothetical protein Avbf_09989 [Armadillidium vulgare]
MVSDEDKEIMRLRLLQFESVGSTADRVGASFGKPNLKPISEEMESLTFSLVNDIKFFIISICIWGLGVGFIMALNIIVMISVMGVEILPSRSWSFFAYNWFRL